MDNRNKMIDSNKVVIECLTCNKRFVVDKHSIGGIKCPKCNRSNELVISKEYLVLK